eukprot:TRINITY_DN87517_c0_g1_i1.p1 TRINITY_DN87517_c0_g1~~TRINITY_DN87517_c0_g1_i1.p1  ORF type:complete len:551 (+),score=85.73 TRINITY_DN87517_c0_g1_i1:27-1655(+)
MSVLDSTRKHACRILRERGLARDQACRSKRAQETKRQQRFHGGRRKASELEFGWQRSALADHLQKNYYVQIYEPVSKILVPTAASNPQRQAFKYSEWWCSRERYIGCTFAGEDSFWQAAQDKRDQRRSEIQRSIDRAAKRSLRVKLRERRQMQASSQRAKGGRHKAKEASFVLNEELGISEVVATEVETSGSVRDIDAGNRLLTTAICEDVNMAAHADGHNLAKLLPTSSADRTIAVVRGMSGRCIAELSLSDSGAIVSEVIFRLATQEQIPASQMDLVHDQVLNPMRSLMHSIGPLLHEAATIEGTPPVELLLLRTRGKVRIPEDCRCISEAVALLPRDGGIIELNGTPEDIFTTHEWGRSTLCIEATVRELTIEASPSAACCLQSTRIQIKCSSDDATGRVCMRGLRNLSGLSMEHCGSKHILIDSCKASFLHLFNCQGEVLVSNCEFSHQSHQRACAVTVEQKTSCAPVKIQNSELAGWPVGVTVFALPNVAQAIHLHATCIKPCPYPIWDPFSGRSHRIRLTGMEEYTSKAARYTRQC